MGYTLQPFAISKPRERGDNRLYTDDQNLVAHPSDQVSLPDSINMGGDGTSLMQNLSMDGERGSRSMSGANGPMAPAHSDTQSIIYSRVSPGTQTSAVGPPRREVSQGAQQNNWSRGGGELKTEVLQGREPVTADISQVKSSQSARHSSSNTTMTLEASSTLCAPPVIKKPPLPSECKVTEPHQRTSSEMASGSTGEMVDACPKVLLGDETVTGEINSGCDSLSQDDGLTLDNGSQIGVTNTRENDDHNTDNSLFKEDELAQNEESATSIPNVSPEKMFTDLSLRSLETDTLPKQLIDSGYSSETASPEARQESAHLDHLNTTSNAELGTKVSESGLGMSASSSKDSIDMQNIEEIPKDKNSIELGQVADSSLDKPPNEMSEMATEENVIEVEQIQNTCQVHVPDSSSDKLSNEMSELVTKEDVIVVEQMQNTCQVPDLELTENRGSDSSLTEVNEALNDSNRVGSEEEMTQGNDEPAGFAEANMNEDSRSSIYRPAPEGEAADEGVMIAWPALSFTQQSSLSLSVALTFHYKLVTIDISKQLFIEKFKTSLDGDIIQQWYATNVKPGNPYVDFKLPEVHKEGAYVGSITGSSSNATAIVKRVKALESQLRKRKVFKEHPGRTCLKYFMLIPFSCNTEIPLEGVSGQHAIKIEFVDAIKQEWVHGEKRRDFSPSIYKATKSGEEPIFFIGEFPKVLYLAYQLKDKEIAAVDTRLEANRFYFTMNNLLNHRLNRECNDTAVLLCYPDDEMAAGDVLWSALNEEIERVQQDRTSIARELSYFKNMTVNLPSEPCKYDATISCLSDSECDGKVAENIASVLESHGKKVVTRSAGDGQWGELDNAAWNIVVMSRDSFKGDHCKIELFSAIFRCAVNKLIQMLYVISGMRMDEVPNALRWVTMISTEQKNYAEIIYDQMEGNVVHMKEKMPAGDVSTGLAWAYLLNYLHIPLADKTETGLGEEPVIVTKAGASVTLHCCDNPPGAQRVWRIGNIHFNSKRKGWIEADDGSLEIELNDGSIEMGCCYFNGTGLKEVYQQNIPALLSYQTAFTATPLIDFFEKATKHLQDRIQTYDYLPLLYVFLFSNKEVLKLDEPGGPITNLSPAEPPAMKYQARTVARQCYINMYKYRYQDTSQEETLRHEKPRTLPQGITTLLQWITKKPSNTHRALLDELTSTETYSQRPEYLHKEDKIMEGYRQYIELLTETICNKADWGSRHTANGKEKDWTSILTLKMLECIICFLDKNSRYTGIEKKNCWTSILEMIQKIEPLERHQFINCLMELSTLQPDERNQLFFLQENIPKHMWRELIECMGYQETYRNDYVLKMLANLYLPAIVLDQRYHILYSEKFLYYFLSFKPSKHIYISSAFAIELLLILLQEKNSDEVKRDLDHLNDIDGKKVDKDLSTELPVIYSEEEFQDLKTLKENNSATIKETDYKFHDSDENNVYETSEHPEWIFYNSYKDKVHVTTKQPDNIFHNSDENNVHETYLKRDDVLHDPDENNVYKTVTGDMLHELDRNDISELKGLTSDDDVGIKENTTAQAINSHSEKLVHVDNSQGAVEKCRVVGSTTERLFLRLSKSAQPIEPHKLCYYKFDSECTGVRNQPGLKAKISSLAKLHLETDIDSCCKCDHVTEIDSHAKCDLETDVDLLTKYDHETGKGLKDHDCSRLRDITWLPVSQLPVPRLELTVAIVHSQAQQVLDRIAGGETVGVQDSMKFEILRVCTFRTYPGENKPFRILLASAGLYFASEGDEVICYTCGIRRSGWNEYDKPMEIHKQLRPNCAFLLKNESVNVPIPELSADSLLKFRVLEEVISSSGTAPVLTRQRNEQPTGRYGNFDLNTTESPQYRFFTPPPKHPQYAVQSVRLDSFNGWPENILQTPTVMAECGYYYAGFGDCVRCFHCGIGLRHWTEEDHPWIEHARWSRDCAYLRQKKGEEFIQNVHLAIEAEEEPEDIMPPTATGQPADMIQATPNDEMSELLQTDAAQSVLEMGYQPKVIKKAIDIILQAEGKSGISALKIMENVFILEEQESDLLEQQVGNLTISGSVSEDAANYIGKASAKSNSSDELSQNTPKIVETSRPVKPNSLDDLQRSASEFNSSHPVKPNSLDELQRSASEFNSQNTSNTGEKQRVTSGDVEKRTTGEQAKGEASTTLKQGMAGAENKQSSASGQGTSMTASRGGQIYTGSGSSKKKKSKSAKGKSKNVPQPPSPATSVDKDPGAASAQPSPQASLDEKGASSGEPRSLKESTSIKAENRKLKKEAICKICLDKPVAIVFLPCGHLVTCEECSQAMRKCPICRGPVNGSVRAFRS